ncbi:MAG: diacylglycerol kinase family protein, partial [Planctomycetia bacterium]
MSAARRLKVDPVRPSPVPAFRLVTSEVLEATDRSLLGPPPDWHARRWVPVLMNRTAGPRRRGGVVPGLVEQLRRNGLEPDVYTDRAAFAAATADGAADAACRCLVAAGGDGTVAWVLNQSRAMGPGAAPIAVVPLGSENLLARRLGV